MAPSSVSPAISNPLDVFDFVVNKGNGAKGLVDMGLKGIPEQYIQPLEERLDMSKVVTGKSLPVIDVSNWDDPKVAESICDAATKLGFFQIINHGVPLEVLDKVKEAAHLFFGLPAEERSKYLKENTPSNTVYLKTSFVPHQEKILEWKDHLSHNYTPQGVGSEFWPTVSRDQVLEYMKWAKPVIRRVLEVLLKGLNVKEMDEAREAMLMGRLDINLNYYAKCPNPELTTGASCHSDASTITVLLQDGTGGLCVRASPTESWIHVQPMKGALGIVVGDALQIMSNDRYSSVEHCVIVNSEQNRVSVPVFVNPVPDAVIGPLPEVLEGGEKPVYKQIRSLDYLLYFFSKPHDGKDTLEFAKI